MVQINFAQKQVNAKIVYYGPGMSGKTTNLEVVHQRAPEPNRGDLTSISTDGDRTLFFDFMPLDLGTVAGMRTCFQIYTVPGQVYYNSTRKLVLQGVDGVIFVADSSASMQEENLESMRNLEENLNEYGKSLASMPHVIQYNKRDLPDAMSVEDLNALLNQHNAPHFEAIASSGQGVFPTLKALAARVLDSIHTSQSSGGTASPAPTRAATGFYPAQPTAADGTPAGAPMSAPGGAPGMRAPAPQPPPAAAPVPPAQPQPLQPSAQGLPPVQPAPQAPLAQTGFQPQGPQMAPQQQGYAPQPGMPPAGSAQPAQMAQPAYHPQLSQTGFRQVQPGSVDALARTNVHAPPAMQPQQPQAGPPGLRMAAQPNPGMPVATAAPHARPVPAGGASPMQVEATEAAPPQRPPARSARPVRAQKEAPRLQPRAAASPTPVRKPKKKALMYAGVFLVLALGAGAVLGRFILKVF